MLDFEAPVFSVQSYFQSNNQSYYRPQKKFAIAMFSQVSVCLQGGCLSPPGRHPPGRHNPRQCMLGYGQQAGGIYPTIPLECILVLNFNFFSKFVQHKYACLLALLTQLLIFTYISHVHFLHLDLLGREM